jgi:hypothetical protein
MAAIASRVDLPLISDSPVAAAQVLLCLRSVRGELSPQELLDRVRDSSRHLKEIDIKRAVWHLMDSGEVVLSPRQRLSARKTNSLSRARPLDDGENESVERGLSIVEGAA